MRMVNPVYRGPCTVDCPRRSEICHTTCKEYKDAVASHAEKSIKARAIYSAEHDYEGFLISAINKAKGGVKSRMI